MGKEIKANVPGQVVDLKVQSIGSCCQSSRKRLWISSRGRDVTNRNSDYAKLD